MSPGVEFFPATAPPGRFRRRTGGTASHRVRMFLRATQRRQHARVDGAGGRQTERTGAQVKKLEPKFDDVNVFFDSLSPPQLPVPGQRGPGRGGRDPLPRQEPVGRLAATSRSRSRPRQRLVLVVPRRLLAAFASRPTYLPDAAAEGHRGQHHADRDDRHRPARTQLVNEQFKRAWNTSWWGYDDLNPKWTKDGQGRPGTTFERMANDYNAQNSRLEGPNKWSNSPLGYEAPPLYGAWASAPYFHNGSVPTIRDILQPGRARRCGTRPRTKPAQSGIVQGLDPTSTATTSPTSATSTAPSSATRAGSRRPTSRASRRAAR